MSGVTAAIVTNTAAFLALRHEWQALHEESAHPTPYRDFDWAELVWQQSGHGRRVVTVREAGRLVLALPMMTVPYALLLRRIYVMATSLPQASDGVMAPEGNVAAWMAAALKALGGDRRVTELCLDRLPARSPFLPALEAYTRSQTVLRTAPGVALEEGFETYFNRFDRKSRSQHRRMLKQMEQRGGASIRISRAGEYEADLGWLLQQKRQWTPARGETLRAWLTSTQAETFLVELGRRWIEPGKLWLGVLEVGGKRVAANLMFRAGDEMVCYAIAYDPAYAQFSPGHTLMLELLQRAADAGVTYVDLMSGDAPWKQRLQTTAHDVLKLRVPLLR